MTRLGSWKLWRGQRRSGRRVFTVGIVLASFVGVTASPAYAPTSCPTPMTSNDVFLLSEVNGLGVTAELGSTGDSYGQLRARAGAIGAWEWFRLVCVSGTDVYAIRSVQSGRYVTAEISWTGDRNGLLRARATSIGPWERFRIPNTSSMGGVTIFSLANDRYVTTEIGRSGELRARASVAGAWERYILFW
jgi:hypothetical protein